MSEAEIKSELSVRLIPVFFGLAAAGVLSCRGKSVSLQTPSSSAALVDLYPTHTNTKTEQNLCDVSTKSVRKTRRHAHRYKRCGKKRRRTDSSLLSQFAGVIIYFITHDPLWESLLSHSAVSVCRRPPAGLFTGALGNNADSLCCYRTRSRRLKPKPAGGSSVHPPTESRPQPARNPPAAPLDSRDRPRCTPRDRGEERNSSAGDSVTTEMCMRRTELKKRANISTEESGTIKKM